MSVHTVFEFTTLYLLTNRRRKSRAKEMFIPNWDDSPAGHSINQRRPKSRLPPTAAPPTHTPPKPQPGTSPGVPHAHNTQHPARGGCLDTPPRPTKPLSTFQSFLSLCTRGCTHHSACFFTSAGPYSQVSTRTKPHLLSHTCLLSVKRVCTTAPVVKRSVPSRRSSLLPVHAVGLQASSESP